MTAYRAAWRPQAPTNSNDPNRWKECAAVAGGLTADRTQLGVNPRHTTAPWLPAIYKLTYGWKSILPTMATAIYNWCQKYIPAAHTTEGLTLTWVNQALASLYGIITVGYRWNASWSTYWSYLTSGRGTTVSVMYWAFHGTPYDGDPGFSGRHAIYVGEYRKLPTKTYTEVLVDDGLCDHRFGYIPQGPQWMPASLLKKAMLAACNNTGVEFSYTKVTTGGSAG